jgi:hypothetical protein
VSGRLPLSATGQRRRAEREAEQERQLAWHPDLLASASGVRRAVAELHAPDEDPAYAYPICRGCDAAGYDVEPPEWPCRTYVLVRDYDLEAE